MSKFLDAFSGIEYDTKEECQEVVSERLSDCDIEDHLGMIATDMEILDELCRLGSPLYYRVVEAALDELYDRYIVELEEDEDDE